jgi:hypothetical protein
MTNLYFLPNSINLTTLATTGPKVEQEPTLHLTLDPELAFADIELSFSPVEEREILSTK